MQNTDSFIVGYRPAVKAQKAKKAKFDENGILIHPDIPEIDAEPQRKGYKVTLRVPIPFHVILKAVEFLSDSVADHVRSGEIIVKSQVVKDEDWETVEKDGTLMMSLCVAVAGVYLTAEMVEKVKKNSPPIDSTK